jgi:NAD(P)-dependent dehydrogenase (short-subunit alcohol dehydrogenase family)
MNVRQMFDLTGRVAVITGAGSGLGYEYAQAMAEAGADVVCADIDDAGNARTAEHVRAQGRQALAVRCDVTRESRCRRSLRAGGGKIRAGGYRLRQCRHRRPGAWAAA